jgi:trehalose 6-phosphate synthase
VPFPSPEVFAALPWAEELAMDLLSYDLVGFQTEICAENFRGYLQRYANGTVDPDKRVTAEGQSALTGVFPIGIDPDDFADIAASPDAAATTAELQRNFDEVTLIAGVERLDYSKGIVEHFKAFERLLETSPCYRGRLFLCQVAAPSRTFIPEYEAIGRQVEEMAGHINGRFGTFEWTPVHFIARPVSRPHVAGLYRASKVGLITPLRDGMNLVAKEYVAAQDPADPGVLVLSSFAGAAVEMTDALLVNPRDTEQTANAIRVAIEMPLAERRERWQRMMARLRANDTQTWCNTFLGELDTACRQVRRAAYGS